MSKVVDNAWDADRTLISLIRNYGDEMLVEASGCLPVTVDELLKRWEAALERIDELEEEIEERNQHAMERALR
jgi:hypothetical protein